MEAQADNGVILKKDVTTTTGALYLDADVDNQNDADNKVGFTDARTVTSKTILTLESTTGSIVPAGTLTLAAGMGIVIHNAMTGKATSKSLVINADYESHGDGTLTIVATKTFDSNDSLIQLTVWDLDMAGDMDAGTATMQLHGAKLTQTIGLGITSKDMHLDAAELGKVWASNPK